MYVQSPSSLYEVRQIPAIDDGKSDVPEPETPDDAAPTRTGWPARDYSNDRSPGWVPAEKRVVAARRVADLLRGRILDGHGAHRLAAEELLTKEFLVSRNTVRSAMAILQDEGTISRSRGTGSFSRPYAGAFEINQFDASGLQVIEPEPAEVIADPAASFRVVMTGRVSPTPPALAQLLEIEPTVAVVLVEKLALRDNTPFALLTSYFPADLAEGVLEADLTESSAVFLPAIIAPLRMVETTARFSAIPCDEPTAALLGIAAGAPLMLHENRKRADNGRIVDYTYRRNRGDRYAVTWSTRDDANPTGS